MYIDILFFFSLLGVEMTIYIHKLCFYYIYITLIIQEGKKFKYLLSYSSNLYWYSILFGLLGVEMIMNINKLDFYVKNLDI
jgi:hypothetical protein